MLNATDLKNVSIENSSTIPSEFYSNKDIYDLEKNAIFDKSWHLIGSQSRIPNFGDTLNAEVLDEPILIVRQKDLSLKAFFNVCQHRGGPLVRKNCRLNHFNVDIMAGYITSMVPYKKHEIFQGLKILKNKTTD